jgi:outer membrane lipoprotein carrier protein
MKNLFRLMVVGAFTVLGTAAHADATDMLREFVRDAKTGRAEFTQTVISPDGARKKVSSGTFEFSRPNRFRFSYLKPFAQDIVADGQKVWIYDADLNQASSRKMSAAIGATPAALLAGGSLEKDFDLKTQPDRDGLSWTQALPKTPDGPFKSMQIGFKGKTLAAVEILDSFGQRSVLQFNNMATNVSTEASRFQFKLPQGADLIEQ